MTETTIAEHALIGDLQTAALVTTDGSIDWFCTPRFDAPSVFGALLDDERGGRFRIRPAGGLRELADVPPGHRGADHPVPGRTASARWSTSCRRATAPPPAHRIARLVRCVRGRMTFDVVVAPRFDYGRRRTRRCSSRTGPCSSRATRPWCCTLVREPGDEHLADARVEGGDVHLRLTLTAGQVRGVVLETGAAEPPREIRVAEFTELFDTTVNWWRAWLARSTYRGRWREMVTRSAITLKLLTYAPTGAPGRRAHARAARAARRRTQLGLPLHLGPGCLVLGFGLLALGFTEEAARFGRWLGDRIREGGGGTGGPLAVLYRVDGTSDLQEESLAHWSGLPRRESRPDRQRRGRAAAARHLRRGPRQRLRRRPRGVRAPPPGWTASARCSTGSASTGTRPRRASGRPAAARKSSPTAG